MTSRTTRRGFLKASATAAVSTTACARGKTDHRSEVAPGNPPAPTPAPTDTVDIETTVNGKTHALKVGPDDSALELVRDRIGLKGAKLGCGHGACGACAMKVDGVPVATCMLPATSLHRTKVTTVEGLASSSGLHPVQRAFMAEDALQCGFLHPRVRRGSDRVLRCVAG